MKSIYTITIVKDDNDVIHLGIPKIPVENKNLTYYEVMGALECIKMDLKLKSSDRAKEVVSQKN